MGSEQQARRSGDLPCEIEIDSSWGEMLDAEAGPLRCKRPDEREVYLIRGAFTLEECKALIQASEQHGYGATDYPKSYRGNLRLITTDRSLTEVMWRRLQPLVPATVLEDGEVWEAIGLNECWRLAKYHPGDRFQRHCDASFQRSDSEMSMFTVNIYMNGDFKGGATRFFAGTSAEEPNLSVIPEPGLCLIFRQPAGQLYYHDGEQVTAGQKYLFRSDVMYRRRG